MIGADKGLAQPGGRSRPLFRLLAVLGCVLAFWAFTRKVSKRAESNPSAASVPVGTPAPANRWERMDALKAETKSNPVAARAWKLCLDNPSWAVGDCRLIAQKKLRIGFTAEQCLEAWGRPERSRTTRSATGYSELWVYAGPNYLYLEDGILVAIDQ